jgi:hypothetical protein
MTGRQVVGRILVGFIALFLVPIGFIAAGFIGAILSIILCMLVIYMRDKVWSNPKAKWWH